MLHDDKNDDPLDFVNPPSADKSSKVFSAIGSGFWTCVDMASGRYLWRHLVSSEKSSS
ncbi:hypothetical protein L1049_013181 [Liquidambar formosana]|uniref:Uncharacterized protein n=1 Tax=Liquidambar formosana TaxID=63359 RepID=A0AAP0WU27_LIQFO